MLNKKYIVQWEQNSVYKNLVNVYASETSSIQNPQIEYKINCYIYRNLQPKKKKKKNIRKKFISLLRKKILPVGTMEEFVFFHKIFPKFMTITCIG